MVRKLVAAGASAALMLASAIPALGHHRPNVTVGIVKDNNVTAIANTGLNRQSGGGKQFMRTGDADAYAEQYNEVNTGCGCPDGRRGSKTIGVVKNNDVTAIANTGLNNQTGGRIHHHGPHGGGGPSGGLQMMSTGDAYATAIQWNIVNSSVSP